MEEALKEFNESLRGLSHAVRELHSQELETRDAMGELATSSHLRSTMQMLKEDVSFRKIIYQV